MNTEETNPPAVVLSTAQLAPKLRLFVWTDFCPDYTGGLAFAIAKDETDARKQIEKDRVYSIYEWGTLRIYPLTKRIARSVSGGG
jgi:hypothetical protein